MVSKFIMALGREVGRGSGDGVANRGAYSRNFRVNGKRAGHNVVEVRVARRMLSGKGVPASGTAGVTEQGADAQV